MTSTVQGRNQQHLKVVHAFGRFVDRQARLVKRRARLERVRKALQDFEAGRISKTEYRKLVPRSYPLPW